MILASARNVSQSSADGEPLHLDDRALKLAAQQFRLVADPIRLRILSLLSEAELNVTALCEAVQRAQPNVSQNLTLLRLAGLIRGERRGRTIVYSLTDDGWALLDCCRYQFTR